MAETDGKKKMGRPKEEHKKEKAQAIEIALLGHTDKQICAILDIDESTFTLWKQADSAFLTSLKEAKFKSDTEVEASLRKRAMGFTYTQKAYGKKAGKVLTYDVYVPPDTTACIFWLKNRQAEQWRDKQEHTLKPGDDWLGALDAYSKIKNGTTTEQGSTKQSG